MGGVPVVGRAVQGDQHVGDGAVFGVVPVSDHIQGAGLVGVELGVDLFGEDALRCDALVDQSGVVGVVELAAGGVVEGVHGLAEYGGADGADGAGGWERQLEVGV